MVSRLELNPFYNGKPSKTRGWHESCQGLAYCHDFLKPKLLLLCSSSLHFLGMIWPQAVSKILHVTELSSLFHGCEDWKSLCYAPKPVTLQVWLAITPLLRRKLPLNIWELLRITPFTPNSNFIGRSEWSININ